MKCDKNMMRLYAVTDRAYVGVKSLYEQVEEALRNGVTCLQIREKDLEEEAFLKEAIELRRLCKEYQIPFIVNDNVDIAIQSGADGIHVGQEDLSVCNVRSRVGSEMMIGVSAHNVAEALKAEKEGADYLGIGAVFASATKTDAKPMSYDTIRQICDAVSIPVVAIGGIGKKNIHKLSGSGVDGVAVISDLFGAEDIGAATAELRALVSEILVP